MMAESAMSTPMRSLLIDRLNKRPNRIGSQSEIPMRSRTTRGLLPRPRPRTLREGRTEAYAKSFVPTSQADIDMEQRVFCARLSEAVEARTVPRLTTSQELAGGRAVTDDRIAGSAICGMLNSMRDPATIPHGRSNSGCPGASFRLRLRIRHTRGTVWRRWRSALSV
jgi:hypothetical protein